MARRHTLHMGTFGWTEPDWVGTFYPEGTDERGLLAAYAQLFDVVEVIADDWPELTAELVDSWRQATPRKFQFVVRAPRLITHEKCLLGCRDDFRSLLDTIKTLDTKLHSVVLEFPHFKKEAFPSAKEFYDRLDRFLNSARDPDVSMAVEIRNKNWLTPQWFELLKKYDVTCALTDHPWMPAIEEALVDPGSLPGRLVHIRLHGDPDARKRSEADRRKTSIDRTADLERLAAGISQAASERDILVLADDGYSGHAPSTLHDLTNLIGRHSTIES